MKYKLTFEFTVVKPHPTAGIGFQKLSGDVCVDASAPLSVDDKETCYHLEEMVVQDLLKQGHNVVRNMFKILDLGKINA